jgi:UPF0755 protein
MARVLVGILGFVLLIGVSLGGLGYWWKTERTLGAPVRYHLQKGSSLSRVAKELENRGVIGPSFLFKAMIYLESGFNVKAGFYKFEGNVSPREVYRKLNLGEEFREVVLTLTIPEGFTLIQILKRLEANKLGNLSELSELIEDRTWFETYKINSQTLEGYLYPETYVYHNELPTAKQVIRDMLEAFQKNIPPGYEQNLKALGLSLGDGVKFASLIERETKHADERAKVSEVIWNRLRRSEPLGIDAGLIYGIKNYDGDIRSRDLVDRSNPYNSRIFVGLPPTPIGAVSRASMEAVLTPTQEGYYYYVLIADGLERHHFSKTLREHNIYVKKLLEGRK